jgi:hypothetical protein
MRREGRTTMSQGPLSWDQEREGESNVATVERRSANKLGRRSHNCMTASGEMIGDE